MFDALLPTKLFLPPARPDWVMRPRLVEQLTASGQARLILVCAPAGYGKTTLIAGWLRQVQDAGTAHACWLAVDEDDSDPQRFFRYLAAAIKPLPKVQHALPQLLQGDQPVSSKTLVQALVHDVADVATPFFLVLDDYHALQSFEIDEALSNLLEWMPPQMTLVLTSRSDPGFPLARLRARGQMHEVRADDLRFTEVEAAQFLRQTMGLTLQPEQIAALEARTEGWIAGLQIAAHSLQKQDAAAQKRFVRGFTGSHRFVLDYLVEEALEEQPADVRDFLLATSILDRLTGPLCDAVTKQHNGQAMLEQLERQNLFVTPLDEERNWYRYHHLFADVLQAHASADRSAQVKVWHHRAAVWLAEHDLLTDAIRHALAAHDFEQSARLLELLRPSIDGAYQISAWLEWAATLPEALLPTRPVLNAGYGWALLELGEMPQGAERLTHVARQLDGPTDDLIVEDPEQWRTLPASLENGLAYHALALGDVVAAQAHARRALAFFVQHEESHWRRVALSLLGVSAWMGGDIPAAAAAFADGTHSLRSAGRLADAVSAAFVLAELQITLGQLNQAEAGLQQMLTLANQQDDPPLGTADLQRVMAQVAWERNARAAAFGHLDTARRLGAAAAPTNWPYRLALTEASFSQSQGDLDKALAFLDEAAHNYTENPLPVVRPLPTLRARIWIAQGRLDEATAWADAHSVSTTDSPTFLHEFEHLTLARLLLARGQQGADQSALTVAHDLLVRLRRAAEAGGRTASVLDCLLLEALTHAAQGHGDAALEPLAQALAIAEPENYVRCFVDEGEAMATLLQAAIKASISVPYATRLLAAFQRAEKPGGDAATLTPQSLPEALSARELEVLTLIAAGLKNQEIADEMVISLNTVLYHTKNIYGKLGVRRRGQAVAKAQALQLI